MQEVDKEEENADDEFWKQDFFAEEQEDNDYSTESEDADVADSDFDEAEPADNDGDEEGEQKLRKMLKVKKPKDRPPGWKQAAQRRANMMRAKRAREKEAADEDDEGPSTSAAGVYGSVKTRFELAFACSYAPSCAQVHCCVPCSASSSRQGKLTRAVRRRR